MTPNSQAQVSSVWNANAINLNISFDFTFNINLGCTNANDVMEFVLDYHTYQNSSSVNEPSCDHISLNANGDINHSTTNNLTGPVQASLTSADIGHQQLKSEP